MQRIGLFTRYKFNIHASFVVPDVLPDRSTAAELGGNVARFLFERAGYDRAPFRLDERNGAVYVGNECVLRIVAHPGRTWEVWQAPGLGNFAPHLEVRLDDPLRVLSPARDIYTRGNLEAGTNAYPGFIPVLSSGSTVYGFQSSAFMNGVERSNSGLGPGADVGVYADSRIVREALEVAPACVLNTFQRGERFADLILEEVERRALAAMTEGK